MIRKNENNPLEIKIIKINSKLFDRSPTIFELFSTPTRLNFDEKEKFITAPKSLNSNTRYERKDQLDQIIKLFNQSKEKIKKQPEYINKLVSILKQRRENYQEKRKDLEDVYTITKWRDSNKTKLQKSETMPNIINKRFSSTNNVHFSNNLIEAGITKNSKLPSHASFALSLDFFNSNKLEKIQEDELDNENKYDAGDSMNFLSSRLSNPNFMHNSTKNKPSINGLKLKVNSNKLSINYLKSSMKGTNDLGLNYKRTDKQKKITSKEKKPVNKLKLVDIYNYDKKKWKELQPKKEVTLENLLIRKNTNSYLNEMLGEWGSISKNKNN